MKGIVIYSLVTFNNGLMIARFAQRRVGFRSQQPVESVRVSRLNHEKPRIIVRRFIH